MENVEVTFGQQVRKFRKSRQWSQRDLADRMSSLGFQMHQTTVAKLETAARPLRLNEAAALTVIFGIGLSDFCSVQTKPLSSAALDLIRAEAELAAARLQAKQASRRLHDAECRLKHASKSAGSAA